MIVPLYFTRAVSRAAVATTLFIILGFTATAAKAGCGGGLPSFRPEENGTVSASLSCGPHGIRDTFTPGPGYVFTGIRVVLQAHNGTVRTFGKDTFTYMPRRAGNDNFAIAECAILNGTKKGCTTFDVSVTNESRSDFKYPSSN